MYRLHAFISRHVHESQLWTHHGCSSWHVLSQQRRHGLRQLELCGRERRDHLSELHAGRRPCGVRHVWTHEVHRYTTRFGREAVVLMAVRVHGLSELARELAVGLIRGRLHKQYPDLSPRALNLKVLEEIERAG